MYLRLAGIANLIIAIAHIVCLFWSDSFFEITGVGDKMTELSTIHWSLPYLLTIVVACTFSIMALYAFSAQGDIRKLPLLKLGIFAIAAIYTFRGLGGLITGYPKDLGGLQTIYSAIALIIGLLYLIGGAKKWYIT